MWPFVCLFTHRALRSSWELVEMCPWVPYRIGIWKCWFLTRGEDWSTQRKTSQSKGENQQQTQPTYGVDVKIQTPATLVGGECSHFWATLAPQWHEVYWTHHRSKMLQVPFATLETRSKLGWVNSNKLQKLFGLLPGTDKKLASSWLARSQWWKVANEHECVCLGNMSLQMNQ